MTDIVHYSSLFSKGLVIGFTSDTIPKLVFKYFYSDTGTLEGYVRFSLSRFATKDFQNNSIPAELPAGLSQDPVECM